MPDLLQETVRHRGYRLLFRFGCRELDCPAKTCTVFLHRTEEEVKNFIRNIKQRCGANHITKPVKQCSFCNTVYELEADICIYCEPKAKHKAELFIERESLEKQLRHAKTEGDKSVLSTLITRIDLELA